MYECPTVCGGLEPSFLSGQGIVLKHSAEGGQGGMCLHLYADKVYIQEPFHHLLDHGAQLLVSKHFVGVHQSGHPDEEASHVGGEDPSGSG